MKKILYLLIIVALSGCATSQRMLFLDQISNDQSEFIDTSSLLEDYAEYDAVYLKIDNSFEHETSTFEYGIPWKFTTIYDNKYMIVNPDNEVFTTFILNVPRNAKLGSVFVTATSPDGQYSKFQLADAVVEKNSDGGKNYKIIYPNVSKGTIIEEAYEITYSSFFTSIPLKHDIRLSLRQPCKKMNITYAYPDWWKVNVKKIAENDTLELIYRHDDKTHKNLIEYKAIDIPAYKNEPFAPYFKEVNKYLQLKVMDLKASHGYMTASKTWQELAREYEHYTLRKDGFLSNRVKKTTKKVTNNCTTPYDKMVAIVNFVQDSISVADDGKIRNFAKILKEGKGDPFRITGLTMSMMKKADLEVEYLAIHDAREGYFDPEYIDYEQFTFPALMVTIENTEYFLFPFLKYLPVGHVPEYFADQTAMIIPDLLHVDSYMLPTNVEFLTIPSANSDDNNIIENYRIIIDEDGVMHVHEEKILNGTAAFALREIISDLDEEEMDEFMNEILTYTDGDVDVKSNEILNLDNYKKPLSLILEYEIDNLIMVTSEEVVFQTGGLFSPSSIKKYKIDTEERINPIKIYYDQKYFKNIDINFPENWSVQSKLEPIAMENEFGSITGNYKIDGNNLKVEQYRMLKKSNAPKEMIKELLKINGKTSQLYIPTIVFDVLGK